MQCALIPKAFVELLEELFLLGIELFGISDGDLCDKLPIRRGVEDFYPLVFKDKLRAIFGISGEL